MTLGFHWLAEARGCDPASIRDPAQVHAALNHLSQALGLTVVGGPTVQVHAEGLLVGMVLLAESHASIHVPATGDRFLADVFSCVQFEPQLAADLLSDAFGGTVTGQLVRR